LKKKKFVDDPKNVNLFSDPPSGGKQWQQGPKNSNPAKRTKTFEVKVILSLFSTIKQISVKMFSVYVHIFL